MTQNTTTPTETSRANAAISPSVRVLTGPGQTDSSEELLDTHGPGR